MIGVLQAHGQRLDNLALECTVKDMDEGNKIEGASVIVLQDGAEIENVRTGRNGRFGLYLDFNHEFSIVISKNGFVTKNIYVNTHNVPEDLQAFGFEFGAIIVDLFKEMDGVDYSILEKPIGKLYYEPNVEQFVTDNAYTREIQKGIEELEKAQKQRLKEEEENQKRLEEDFRVAMNDAQQAMRDGDYLLAKDNLLAAQSMKPESQEPALLLRQVESQLSNAEAKEERYQSVLASADAKFSAQAYSEAIELYTEASGINPDESYPKKRIEESRERMKELEQAQFAEAQKAAQEEKYKGFIAQGDQAFGSEKYADAQIYYQRALELKAGESYPTQQIALAKKRIEEQRAQQLLAQNAAQLDAQYADKIDKADAAFKADNLKMAKTHYQAAVELKPSETYPKDQIAAIDQKLKDLESQAAQAAEKEVLDAKYAALIQSGERYYKAGDLNNSVSQFRAALELKQDQTYPQEQIEKIQAELDRIAQIQKEQEDLKNAERAYLAKVEEANKLFNSGKFVEARPVYKEAQELRPDQKHPATQIARIDAELERQEREKDKDAAYASAIEQADQLFNQEKWQESIDVYKRASELKPGEPYPKLKIPEAQKKIDEAALLAAEKKAKEEKEAAFQALVDAGDKLYEAGDRKGAVNKYDQALRIRADEYAKGQVTKISKELDEIEQKEKLAQKQAEIDRQYNEAITRADQQFFVGNYEDAKVSYNVALGYKAEEQYPKDRLVLVEIAEQRAAQESEEQKRWQYETFLRNGNENIANREYGTAKLNFEEARKLYPDEDIPQRKLELIVDLMERERVNQIQQAYQEALSKADRAFASEEYEEAIPLYEAAQKIKPEEPYPTQRINKINQTLVDLANAAKQAEEDSRKRVIEETYDEGRTKVTVRRVIVHGKEDVYKRVVHSWGGKYYFLNEQPITELVWNRETAK